MANAGCAREATLQPAGVAGSAWARYFVARTWLALQGRLPWRLTAFLRDAHDRGVLRQAGAVYEFRHALLRERLAAPASALRGPRSRQPGRPPDADVIALTHRAGAH